jgi:tetratricopeptide (TPR) repeat protein
MTHQEVDWSRFSGEAGGHLFERFCADLLNAQGYAVQHMAKGGNDEGKDILVLRRSDDIAGPPPTVLCLVECKARTSKDRKAISLDDINRSLWALFEHNCGCLVVFTTHKFNSQAVNCFLRVNERGRLKISWVDQDDLLELGRRYPNVWRLHLDHAPPPAAALAEQGPIRVYGETRPIFWGDDEPLGIVIHNTGPVAGRAKLVRNGNVISEAALDHHERTILTIRQTAPPMPNPYEGIEIMFEPAAAAVTTTQLRPDAGGKMEMRRRVDHLFADPGGLRAVVAEAIAARRTVHLRGSAGCGKSRLLAECRRNLPRSLFTDLSRDDEEECLLDALVQQATGWPVHLLAHVPEALVEGLSISSGCAGDHLKVVAEYCAGRAAHTNAAVARALVALISTTLDTLVVDNIQDATDLDEAILKEALSAGAPVCLLATRTDESGLPAKTAHILRARQSIEHVELRLDENTQSRLDAFVRIAAAEAATADFFLKLSAGESFQAWISKLKALRQLGALEVGDDGRLQLLEMPGRTDFGSYAQLQELILFSRLPETLRAPCQDAIQAASVFGETFPVAFIESLLGESGVEALDELERRELIRTMSDPSPYGLCFRFDHALTRNAVAGLVPTTRRRRLHEAAARFVESWPDFQAGGGHYEAGFHYRAAGRDAASLDRYESGARHYLEVGRVASAQHGLLAALPLFDRLPFERSTDSVARELELRELLLESALLVALPEVEWGRQIAAFEIQAHLFPGLPNLARRIGRSHCFNACLKGYLRDAPGGWREMEKAIELLAGIDDPLPHAEALKWGANLKKNLAAYDEAAAMGHRAYELYSQGKNWRGAGETATELSHVYYEMYRLEEALAWGETAHGHYAALGHPSLVARARVDLARMRAVLFPAERRTGEEMEFSVTLARHAGIGSHVAKAMVNWGIYLTLEMSDEGEAAQRFADAAQLLRIYPSAYVESLLRFCETGLVCRPGLATAMKSSPLGEQFVVSCRHLEAPEQIGDRRLQLMLKVLAATENEAVLDWLDRFPASELAVYAGIGLGRAFAARERANPMFTRGGFALYY